MTFARVLLRVAVLSCLLLVIACNGASDVQPLTVVVDDNGNQVEVGATTLVSLGADIIVGDTLDSDGVDLWASIKANDSSGVSVRGIQKDDAIRIESIAGIAWFSDGSTARNILSTIATVGRFVGTAVAPISGIASTIATAASTAGTEIAALQEGGSDPRDGYGRSNGGGDFASNEGGVIVCMPLAKGPMYAHNTNQLADIEKTEGRLDEHIESDNLMKDKCFFPNRLPGGRMEFKARGSGILYLLAFDDDYTDNSGSYEVAFRIERPERPPAN